MRLNEIIIYRDHYRRQLTVTRSPEIADTLARAMVAANRANVEAALDVIFSR